uniref:Uncharacterized protein n=1 Tax=Desertifilum tharense IPPAS B-1220 TaxID=1781255 RepID=A0ACD5H0K3_9CYAN
MGGWGERRELGIRSWGLGRRRELGVREEEDGGRRELKLILTYSPLSTNFDEEGEI